MGPENPIEKIKRQIKRYVCIEHVNKCLAAQIPDPTFSMMTGLDRQMDRWIL